MRKIFLFCLSLFFAGSLMAQLNDADKTAALQLVNANKTAIGLSSDDLNNLAVSSSYFDKTTGFRYVYLIQTYRNIPVYNQMQVLAFKNNQLWSKAGGRITSIDQKVNVANGMPAVSAESAVMAAIADRKLTTSQKAIVFNSKENGRLLEFGKLGISAENITAQLMWYPDPNGGKQVTLAWQVYIIPTTTPDYWLVRIDASNSSSLGADNLTVYDSWDDPNKNFISEAKDKAFKTDFENFQLINPRKFENISGISPMDPSLADNGIYRVIPLPYEAPSFMPGPSTTWHAIRNNPWVGAGISANSVTLKWHSDDATGTDYNYTRGNDTWAYHDRLNQNTGDPARSATSTTALPNLTFDFTPDYTMEPIVTSPPNQQFNITNLFYWNNVIHDVMYNYGFDEVSGNFQTNNLGRGGLGGDYVRAEAQDGGGTNNANFATPPDGSLPRMQMYLFTAPTPDRDGDVDNGVVTHEFGHGISNRLTGGPATTSCLGNAEQGGEGWADYQSLMFTQDWAASNVNSGFNNPRGIGTYVLNQATNGAGIRNQKYCTNFAVNNQVYLASLPPEVHNLGEILCEALWEMTWAIIQQVGTINPNIYDLAGGGGNNIAWKLVIEGFKLQPCSPGFIDARNAIIQADINLYGGTHLCAIQEAFRKRGMGFGASQGSSNSVTDQIPSFAPFPGTGAFTLLQNGVTSTPEGVNINYTNRLVVGNCGSLTNYLITDTLPLNVTFVSATSGGTYNGGNRVVSWTVNQAQNTTVDYNFVVNINAGAYYAPITILNEPVTVSPPALPAGWTSTSTPAGNNWVSTVAQSHSAPNSLFTSNLPSVSEQSLVSPTVSIPASPPTMTFWHFYNSELIWDGGVLEISTNGGGSYTDIGPANFISGGYNGTLNASGNPLGGRPAFTGTSSGFIKSTVSLTPYASQANVKFRWRFGSDASVAVVGWYVDDILIQDIAHVDMRSNLFNASLVRQNFSDSIMLITPPVSCTPPTISDFLVVQPTCAVPTGTISITAFGTGTLQYSVNGAAGPWQLSNTFSGLAPGSYNLAVRLQSNPACITIFGGSPVVLNPATGCPCVPPIVNAPTVTQPTCSTATGTIVVNTTGGTGTLEFSINNGATWFSSPTFSGLIPGNYTVLARTGPTCVVAYAGNPVVINPQPPTPVGSAASQTICSGSASSVALNSTVVGTTFTWTAAIQTVPTGGTITGFSNCAAACGTNIAQTLTNTGTTAGVVRYTITPTAGACVGATFTVDVTVNPRPVGSASPQTICSGATTSVALSSTLAGTTYTWTAAIQTAPTGGTITGFSNCAAACGTTIAQTLTNTGTSVGVVRYTVTPTNGTCTGIAFTVDVTVNVPPTVTCPANITVPSTIGACTAVVTYTATVTGSPVPTLTYSFTGATTGSGSGSGSGSTFNVGTTTVTITANNGCGTTASCSFTITVTDAQLPVISVQPQIKTACVGDNVTFSVTASNALTYQWQSWNGITTWNNIAGATASTYTLNSVTTSLNTFSYRVIVNGLCTQVTSTHASVYVNPLPMIALVASRPPILLPGQFVTITAQVSPGGGTFVWRKNGVVIAGATGSSLANLSVDDIGTYQCTYTDPNGCVSTSATLTVSGEPSNNLYVYPVPNFGQFHVRFFNQTNENVTLSVIDALGQVVYQRKFTTTTQYSNINVDLGGSIPNGTYVVEVLNSANKRVAARKIIVEHQ